MFEKDASGQGKFNAEGSDDASLLSLTTTAGGFWEG
jgi:hypothetical protein